MPGGITPPLSVLASWPTPNYDDPVRRGYGLVILSSVLAFFSILFVSLRLWTRAVVTRNFGSDDWIMVAATPVAIGLAVAVSLASKVYYFDRHTWDVPVRDGLIETRKITFAIEFLYIWSVGPIKISILLFYRRLSKGIVSKFGDWFIWAMIAFVIAYMITFTCTLIFTCNPIPAYWLQVDPFWAPTHSFSCTSDAPTLLAASGTSLVQDLLVAGLPTIFFVRMDIPWRQKVAMALVFAVGFFLCITAALRIVYIDRIFNETYDVVWAAQEAWIWTVVEVLVGTIVASMPALKVFVQRHLDTISRSYYGRSAGDNSRPSPSRMSGGLNWLKGNKRMSKNNAWAWQRTPSNAEHGEGGIQMEPMEKPFTHTTTSDGRDTPIEHAKKITAADISVCGSEYGHDDSADDWSSRRYAKKALSSHPISPTSPSSYSQRFAREQFPEDKRGTWLSNETSGYTTRVTATGASYDEGAKFGGFDPDQHALPILTEQESRDMGLVGTAV